MGPRIGTLLRSLAALSAALAFHGFAQPLAAGRTSEAEQRPAPPQEQTDTAAWERYFAAWEVRSPDDAQLWIERFNFYFNRSRQSVVVLLPAENGAKPLPGASDERFPLVDSAGVEAGCLTEQTRFDERLFTKAIAAVDRGIVLHPDRLDMLLGRAAAFRFAERYGEMAASLCTLMDRAEQNGGAWVAPDGTPLQVAPRELIADYLQDYCAFLFDAAASSAAADSALGRLVERETRYCPDSPVACNNAAARHFGAGRTDAALEWFIRASEAAPDDATAIYNIGYVYAARGDREHAREWWSRLLDVADETYRKAAPELLRRLDESH